MILNVPKQKEKRSHAYQNPLIETHSVAGDRKAVTAYWSYNPKHTSDDGQCIQTHLRKQLPLAGTRTPLWWMIILFGDNNN